MNSAQDSYAREPFIKKNGELYRFLPEKVWWNGKIAVPLHPQFGRTS
jgi:hypothetical protein